MRKKPVQVQDYEKDKDEDEGEVILTSLMGVPVRCKAISGMYLPRFPKHTPKLGKITIDVLKYYTSDPSSQRASNVLE
jgi:hypothetical protein